ncbi:TPR repeat region-containing protein [Mycobacterium syngnathidarum]
MSALEGFYSTWNKARETFGVGTPTDGSQHDGSSQLLKMQGMVESAAKHDGWQGKGAEAYAAANKEHAGVYGKLAELDKKMAAEVTNAANIVTNGRTQLDTTKSWVDSAVNSLPSGLSAQARENSLIPIAREGITQVNNTVSTANGDMLKIGFRITDIKNQYDELQNQKFGPGDKKGDGQEAHAQPPEAQAENDVKDTLGGNKDAAARVDEVLSGIKPGQELTARQAAYLSQMESQQKDMSAAQLREAREKLGEHGDAIPNSWQLMSNDDVPRSAGKFDEQQKGGFDRLPQSVQDAIKSQGVLADVEVRDIAAVVKSGDEHLQAGTELDRELMRKADRMMDATLFTNGSVFNDHQKVEWVDQTVQDIFGAAGRDHQIVYDQISGNHGDDGQDFLRDITTHEWADDGRAAGSLFEWTKDSPESKLSAQTANIYADFLGRESEKLLAINGNQQIGDLNPELVKSFANGLIPYQDELVTDQPTVDTEFHRLDELTGSMDNTKGLFAVIDSQHDAARDWNKAAYLNAHDLQESFAAYAKDHPDMPKGDTRVDDLQASARMLGAIDGGISQETLSNIHNGEMSAQQAAETAKDAHEFKKDILRSVFSYGKGGDLVTNTFADLIAGPPPDPNQFKFDKSGAITDVGLSSSEQSIGYQNTQAQYTVASQFVHEGNPHIEDRFFDSDGRLLPPNRIDPADWSVYDAQLTTSMAEYTHISPLLQKFNTTLGQVGGYHE